MGGYAKVFTRILDSTIWRETDPARILWITMLALADREGYVYCTIPGLADRARITLIECEKALERFQQPDKYSWSQEQEGRRIKTINGGWFLINHAKFRSMMSAEETRERTRVRVARWREKQKKSLHTVTPVTSNQSNDIASATATTTKSKSKAQSAPVTKSPKTPENLHPVNYAAKLLEDLTLPHTQDNIRIVAAAIQAEIKSGKSSAAAYEFVKAGTFDARDEGYEITRFFFSDAKYRIENRRNGNGANQPNGINQSRQVERAYNNIAAIAAIFGGGNRISESNGSAKVEHPRLGDGTRQTARSRTTHTPILDGKIKRDS